MFFESCYQAIFYIFSGRTPALPQLGNLYFRMLWEEVLQFKSLSLSLALRHHLHNMMTLMQINLCWSYQVSLSCHAHSGLSSGLHLAAQCALMYPT